MAEFNDPASTTFMRWAEPVLKRVQPPAPQHAIPITPLPRRQSIAVMLLCILGALVTAAVGLLFVFWEYLR